MKFGFSLVELLISAAVFVLVLLALGAMFSSSSRAYRVHEGISSRQQDAETSRMLLQSEVSLAGYRGVCATAGSGDPFVSQPVLEIGAAGASHVITVRYLDDRWSGGTGCGSLRVVRFSVGDDGGRSALFMGVDGATPVPAVGGVAGIQVVGYVDVKGGRPPTPPSEGIVAVRIGLTFSDGREGVFTIGLRNVIRGAQVSHL